MDKELVQEDYKKKIKSLNYYNKRYYDDNTSEITDSEYDNLKKDIIDLEKYKFLKSKDSPALIIGYKPSKNFKKFFIKFLCFLFQMRLVKRIL